MQLMQVTATAPATAHARPGAVPPLADAPRAPGASHRVVPGQAIPADAASLPAGEVARRYQRDLFAFPGATSLTWGSRDPELLRVQFADEVSAQVAAGLLRDQLDGVRLEFAVDGSDAAVPMPGHESAISAAARVRAVAAMTGVWAYTYRRTGQEQHGSVMFSTINEGVVDRLKPILRHRISFGWMPSTGEPRYLYFSWYPRVPAGS